MRVVSETCEFEFVMVAIEVISVGGFGSVSGVCGLFVMGLGGFEGLAVGLETCVGLDVMVGGLTGALDKVMTPLSVVTDVRIDVVRVVSFSVSGSSITDSVTPPPGPGRFGNAVTLTTPFTVVVRT